MNDQRILAKARDILRRRAEAAAVPAAEREAQKAALRKQQRAAAALRRRDRIIRRREQDAAEAARITEHRAQFEARRPAFDEQVGVKSADLSVVDKEIDVLQARRDVCVKALDAVKLAFQPYCVHDYDYTLRWYDKHQNTYNPPCIICGYVRYDGRYDGGN